MKLTTQNLKQFFVVTAIMTFALLLLGNIGGTAFAVITGAIDTNDNPEIIGQLGGDLSLRQLVLKIINYFLGFLGLLAVVMVIYGGFLYVSSAGNEENVNKAKKILLYAVIGIVVIIASFALVNAILGAGVDVRNQ